MPTELKEKINLIKSPIITCKHAFSTRTGGISTGIYDSLNLGKKTGDDPQNIKKNWELFGEATGIPTEKIVCAKQVHGSTVLIADKKDMYSPAYTGEWQEADGFVTDKKDVPLAVFTADCVPLLLFEPKAKVIGAIHCGWRSTVADIEAQAINQMQKLGANPSEIRAAIGPSIKKCCFETGKEIPEQIDALLNGQSDGLYEIKDKAKEKYFVDLPGAVYRRLLQLGLKKENISQSELCTMCHPELFWSHRYTNGKRGCQANIIML